MSLQTPQFYQPVAPPRIIAVQIGKEGRQVDEVPFLACYHSPDDPKQKDGFMVFDAADRVPVRLEESCWAQCDAVIVVGFLPPKDPWWDYRIDEAEQRLRGRK